MVRPAVVETAFEVEHIPQVVEVDIPPVVVEEIPHIPSVVAVDIHQIPRVVGVDKVHCTYSDLDSSS